MNFGEAIALAHKIAAMPLIKVPLRPKLLVQVADRQCPKPPPPPKHLSEDVRYLAMQWASEERWRVIRKVVNQTIKARAGSCL